MWPMPARDLVFDLGGVLIDWDPVYLYRDHLGASQSDLDHLLGNVCTPQWHGQLDRGAAFATATADLAVRHPQLAEQIHHWDTGWPQMFKGSLGDADGLLAQLQSDGFRLHALSNYPAEKLDFLYSQFDFMRRFNNVVISGLLATAKPDAGIFVYLAKLLNDRPCIFFDDRIENVNAASAVGLQAHHCPPSCNLARIVADAIRRQPDD